MKPLCKSVSARRALLPLAVVVLISGSLFWRPRPAQVFPVPFTGIPTTLPSLTSEAGAEEPRNHSQASTAADSESSVEADETNEPADPPTTETAPVENLSAQISHVESSPAPTSEATFNWKEYFTSRLSIVKSRIAVAQGRAAIVRHNVEAERTIELAELKLQIATRNRNRYAEGESQRERVLLENQVQLARDRHRQLEERLAWSESLANGGLISQATLDIDDSAVKGSASELKAAEDRLTVFETIDRERNQTQLEAEVLSAQAELQLLQQNTKSRLQELQRNHAAAKRELDFLQAHVEDLAGRSTAEPESVPIEPAEVSRHVKDVEFARSAMQRAERELAEMKDQVDVASQHRRQLRKVQELQLEAFRKGRHSGTLHDLTSRIRIVSEKLAADQQQLTWSRRVIRKGYITPAELRSAEFAVDQREAELLNIRQQKNILSEHTLERDEFELKEKLRHASNELARRERLADARIQELTVVADAKREAWKIRHETFAMLRGERQDTVAEAGGG